MPIPTLTLQDPYGNISTQPVLLMDMLSRCPAWQEWCAESDESFPAETGRAAEALKYIYYSRAPRYAAAVRTCCAVVYPYPRMSLTSDCSDALGDEFTASGNCLISFRRRVPAEFILDATDYAEDDPDEIEENNDVFLDSMAAMNFDGWTDEEGDGHGLGKILDELQALSGQNGDLVINQIQIIDGPGFNDEEDAADTGLCRGARILIRWGIPLE